MQVLLLKDVRRLGHVGDVVDVKPGYARNYLVPQGLASEPTEENVSAIQEIKQRAAEERARRNAEFQKLADRLADVGVTIEAAANPEGTLYGSVGKADIAKALQTQGFEALAEHILLADPIRTLDNRVVTLGFTDEITAQVKVWVVREGSAADDEQSEQRDAEPDEDPVDIDDDE